MTDRKRPGVAFWATVVVVVALVVYPLSMGPACWLVRQGLLAPLTAAHLYRPLININKANRPFYWLSGPLWSYGGTDDDGMPTAGWLAVKLRWEELSAEWLGRDQSVATDDVK